VHLTTQYPAARSEAVPRSPCQAVAADRRANVNRAGAGVNYQPYRFGHAYFVDVVLRSDFLMWAFMKVAGSEMAAFIGVPKELASGASCAAACC
jgi:hypothetical protein